MINLKKEKNKFDSKQDCKFGQILIKEKIHNSKEDLLYLHSLYNSAKKFNTITYDFSNCKYISFICLLMFRMYVDRLRYQDHITVFILEEDVNGKKLKIGMRILEYLYNEDIQDFLFIKNYSLKMKDGPIDDFEKFENFLKNYKLNIRLKQIIGELVGNVLSHTNDGIDYKKYKMYLGIKITTKSVQIIISNNGRPFSNVIYNSDKSKQKYYDVNYEDSQFIVKAMEPNFTTRTNQLGGLGLSVVDNLVSDYFGKIEIISGKSYFCKEYKNKYITTVEDFLYRVPYTIVFIEIEKENINDKSLSSLIDLTDLESFIIGEI